MNKIIKRSLLGLGVTAIPLAIVPTVMSCNTLNLEDQKAIGVNGVQVLDDALGVLKQYDENIVSSAAHTNPQKSMERYKFVITLINPSTKQELQVSFLFMYFWDYNNLAQKISKNYINGKAYKIEFYRLKKNCWYKNWADNNFNEATNGVCYDYANLEKYAKESENFEKVTESSILINNFESNLTFTNMKNLTTDNIQVGINWDEQWVGGIEPNV